MSPLKLLVLQCPVKSCLFITQKLSQKNICRPAFLYLADGMDECEGWVPLTSLNTPLRLFSPNGGPKSPTMPPPTVCFVICLVCSRVVDLTGIFPVLGLVSFVWAYRLRRGYVVARPSSVVRPSVCPLDFPHFPLLPNRLTDQLQTWCGPSGQWVGSRLFKSFWSDIQYGRHGGHLENLFSTSSPEPLVGLSWNLVWSIRTTSRCTVQIVAIRYPIWPPWRPSWKSVFNFFSRTTCRIELKFGREHWDNQ